LSRSPAEVSPALPREPPASVSLQSRRLRCVATIPPSLRGCEVHAGCVGEMPLAGLNAAVTGHRKLAATLPEGRHCRSRAARRADQDPTSRPIAVLGRSARKETLNCAIEREAGYLDRRGFARRCRALGCGHGHPQQTDSGKNRVARRSRASPFGELREPRGLSRPQALPRAAPDGDHDAQVHGWPHQHPGRHPDTDRHHSAIPQRGRDVQSRSAGRTWARS
jgi:hypothetical protein